MHDAARAVAVSGVAAGAWLVGFCRRAIEPWGLGGSFGRFCGRCRGLVGKYRGSVNAVVSDSFPGKFLFRM